MKQFHFPSLLSEIHIQRLRLIYQDRERRIEKIKTKNQAQNYILDVQKKIKACFGKLPKPKPPNAIITKKLDFKGYTIETLLFESRKDFWVSANYYRPKNGLQKLPAVLFIPGHNKEAKGFKLYVEACLRLVQSGFAVLSYDPINQGERKIYSLLGCPQENPKKFNSTRGHNLIGKQLRACGEQLCSWMVWDGMRAIDYLLSKPEIDQKKIGVTGNSGGGALSAYMWALDKRISMVSSSCWTTSFLNDVENDMPDDNEQCPHGFLRKGLDKIDLFISRAGEPAQLLGQERDFFDNRALSKGFDQLLKFHQLMGGKKNQCLLTMDSMTHNLSPKNQMAMTSFFSSIAKPIKNKMIINAPNNLELLATTKGDVHQEKSKPIYSLINDLVNQKTKSKPKGKLINRVIKNLKIKLPLKAPYYRRTHGEGRWAYWSEQFGSNITRFLIEPEPGLLLPLRHVYKKNATPFLLDVEKNTTLFLPDVCSQTELDFKPLKKLPHFWALDARGLGEGLYNPNDYKNYYGIEYMHNSIYHLFDETLLGKRVEDVLNAINLLFQEGAKSLTLIGIRQGALLAMLAGLMDSRLKKIQCYEAIDSIKSITTQAICYWPDVNFPHSLIGQFDIPEIKKTLNKRLKIFSIAKPTGNNYKGN